MSKQVLDNDEVIILEYKGITREDIEGEMDLTLTSKRILFERTTEKGIFKKQEITELLDTIDLTHLKVYQDNIQVNNKNENVSIQTFEENIVVTFLNKKEASKFTSKTIDAATGTTKTKRVMNKAKKVIADVDETLGEGATSKIIKTGTNLAVAFAPIPKGKKGKKVVTTLKKAATVILNSSNDKEND